MSSSLARRLHYGLYRRVGDCGGGLNGFVIRYDLKGSDEQVAGCALKVVPGVGILFVGLRFRLFQWLVAIAIFAEDFFSWHTSLVLARSTPGRVAKYVGTAALSPPPLWLRVELSMTLGEAVAVGMMRGYGWNN